MGRTEQNSGAILDALTDGIAYQNAVATFSLASDNNVVTLAAESDVYCIKVQNESAVDTTVIIKADSTPLDRTVLAGKAACSYCPPRPQRFPAGTVIKVNLNGANAHNCTVLYKAA